MRESAFAGSFDEAVFTDAIKQTMIMGMPQDPAERLTWHWDDVLSTTPVSPSGDPYSWVKVDSSEPTPGVPLRSLQVEYAFEMSSTTSGNTHPNNTLAGTFDNPKAVVTVLDAEYELIKTADYCSVGTSLYRILLHYPEVGLFGVTVHQFLIQAQDEA